MDLFKLAYIQLEKEKTAGIIQSYTLLNVIEKAYFIRKKLDYSSNLRNYMAKLN